MHSSETGSVEMLMELAYRLAVDDSPFIKTIRDNAIVMITPILEVDGRDKYVDIGMALAQGPQDDHYATRFSTGANMSPMTTTGTTSAWRWPSRNISRRSPSIIIPRSCTTSMNRPRIFTSRPVPDPTTPGSTRSSSTNGTNWPTTKWTG